MSLNNFTIYRSSAGSGKTYTLTKEYLKLALQNPAYYKQVLAVTFTNKATQEMKSRIIEQLHLLSKGEDSSLALELEETLLLDKEALIKRAREVLSNILHGYSHFAVSTIDSFFQKVIRAFAKETGLQSGFKIELDLNKVLSEVIDQVLLDVGRNEQLTRWLIKFAENKVEEGKAWDFRGDISGLAKEMFNENFKAFEKDILLIARDKEFIPRVMSKIRALQKEYESQMKAYGEQALKIADDHGLKVEDFAYSYSGVMGFLHKITYKKEYVPGARPKEALLNPNSWSTKSSVNKELISTAVDNGLQNILAEVIDLYHLKHLEYESTNQVLRFIYTFGILSDITQKLQEYREEHDVMLISDAAVFLKDIIGENEAPFIYEKVGSQFRHYLIDEFQDTSAFQWENFKPLVRNSIAEGKANLVVGDVKQSIYRWRGGDWRLLLEQVKEDIGELQTQELQLNQNWRSAPHVIDFNNKFFTLSPLILEAECVAKFAAVDDELLQSLLQQQSAKVKEAYKDVVQQFPAIKENENANKGYVKIEFLENLPDASEEEPRKWKDEVLQRLPKMVEELQDSGYQLRDIAFLVRSKQEGKLIADTLLEYKSSAAKPGYSYDVISSESLYLGSASVIRLLVNCLIYLNNPEDKLARAQIIFGYQKYILKNDHINLHLLFRASANPQGNQQLYNTLLPREFTTKRAYLSKLPLFELVEELVQIFLLNTFKNEFPYLLAFMDAVLEFSRNEKSDINSFLQWWKERGKENAVQVSEELNAIRILTIHKSKGLQFRVVVVPFCDWKLDHNTTFNNILWCGAEDEPFNAIKYLPLKYTGALKDTFYRRDYYEEMIKAQLDAFNLLYVAFTRAEESLYAFGRLPKIDKKGNYRIDSISELLYHILSNDYSRRIEENTTIDGFQNCWDEEQGVFEMGKKYPAKQLKKETPHTVHLSTVLSNPWRNKLAIKHKSKEFFRENENDVTDKINYGLLIHDLLAEIKTHSQLPEALNKMLFEGAINDQERLALELRLEALLAHKNIKPWFTDEWEVKTEVPVLPATGKVRRMDRVMIKGNKAVVVDFKSSKKVTGYQQQVKNYVSLLREMGYDPVEGYLLYLNNGEVEKIV